MMVPIRCCMMVSLRKVRHDGVCRKVLHDVSVWKVLHDGVCQEGPA